MKREKYKSKLLPATIPGENVKTIKETLSPFKKKSKAKLLAEKAGQYVKKGIRFSGYGALLAGGAYLAGAPSRRYKKAPKFGESRDLRDMVLAKPDRRTLY